jgi:hypothetical protein
MIYFLLPFFRDQSKKGLSKFLRILITKLSFHLYTLALRIESLKLLDRSDKDLLRAGGSSLLAFNTNPPLTSSIRRSLQLKFNFINLILRPLSESVGKSKFDLMAMH